MAKFDDFDLDRLESYGESYLLEALTFFVGEQFKGEQGFFSEIDAISNELAWKRINHVSAGEISTAYKRGIPANDPANPGRSAVTTDHKSNNNIWVVTEEIPDSSGGIRWFWTEAEAEAYFEKEKAHGDQNLNLYVDDVTSMMTEYVDTVYVVHEPPTKPIKTHIPIKGTGYTDLMDETLEATITGQLRIAKEAGGSAEGLAVAALKGAGIFDELVKHIKSGDWD